MFGSRNWENPTPIEVVIVGRLMLAREAGDTLTIVHGNHGKADKFADAIGRRYGATVIPVDPDWERYKKGAGPIRNGVMLKEHRIQEGWGFRMPGDSPGTDDMIDKLRRACIPHFVATDPAAATPTLF
jgi:hypothetical protein